MSVWFKRCYLLITSDAIWYNFGSVKNLVSDLGQRFVAAKVFVVEL